MIHSYGHWLNALATGRIAPADVYNEHFFALLRGEGQAQNPAEAAWLRFAKDYPDRSVLETPPAGAGGMKAE